MYMVEGLLSVAPDEGFHEGGLADARGANDSNNGRRGLVIGSTIDEGDMEAGLVTLCSTTALPVCIPARPGGKCLQNNVNGE